MAHYLKFAGIFFGSIALVPFLLGLLSTLPVGRSLAVVGLGLLTVLVALVIGALVLLIHGVRCARHTPDPLLRAVAVLASPVLTLAVLLAILPLAVFGHNLGRLANPLELPRLEQAPPIIVQERPPPIIVRPTALENSSAGY